MKKIIKCCLVAVLSLVHFQSCAHEELFTEDQIALTEEIEKYVNEDAATKDPVFIFDPERWGIVQGRISDEVALNNKNILNGIISKLVEMGVSTMEIGAMDAYFKVDVNKIGREENSEGSIQIPSNFHLKMSDDTYLRVQPNSAATYTLMTTYLTDNVTISGGHLIGDRFEHDYSPFTDAAGVKRDEHGWGQLLWVIGSHNTVIDNLKISKATGDGLVFHSKDLRNSDGSLQANNREVYNVLVKNVVVDECRRNGISILDGRKITFDNCKVTNTGNGEQAFDSSGSKIYSASGTKPMVGMDLEAIRTRDDNNVFHETAVIDDIKIVNSVFAENALGDIIVYTATNVLIENNEFDNWVANFASSYVSILNNTFQCRAPKEGVHDPWNIGIGIKSYINQNGEELNHHYTIKGNTIKDYATGMWVAGKNQIITDNLIENSTTGVLLISDLYDSEFSGNRIVSNRDISYGYKNLYNMQNVDNIVISGEQINVQNRPINFSQMLGDSELMKAQIVFQNCEFKTNSRHFTMLIKNAKNIEFVNNKSNTDFSVLNSENIILNNNLLNILEW